MSFVVTAPAATLAEEPIVNAAFWPNIDPVAMREQHRIDNTITPPRLLGALIEAMAAVNQELATWRAQQQGAGYGTLATVPAEEIGGTSINTHRYQRAIGCTAKALLLERYRDFDSTAKGDKKADALADPIDDLRRDARWAIADIQGRGRSTVELI